MTKVSVLDNGHNWWLVKFEFPDLDSQSFGFATKADALNAIKLAQFFRDNEISFKEITVQD